MADFVNNPERALPPSGQHPGTGPGMWDKSLRSAWSEDGGLGLGSPEAR